MKRLRDEYKKQGDDKVALELKKSNDLFTADYNTWINRKIGDTIKLQRAVCTEWSITLSIVNVNTSIIDDLIKKLDIDGDINDNKITILRDDNKLTITDNILQKIITNQLKPAVPAVINGAIVPTPQTFVRFLMIDQSIEIDSGLLIEIKKCIKDWQLAGITKSLSIVKIPKRTYDNILNWCIYEMKIDIFNNVVDEKSFVFCKNCEHTIRFKLVKI